MSTLVREIIAVEPSGFRFRNGKRVIVHDILTKNTGGPFRDDRPTWMISRACGEGLSEGANHYDTEEEALRAF